MSMSQEVSGGRRRAEEPKRSKSTSTIIKLVIAAVLLIGVGWAGFKVVGKLMGPPDYDGQGTGEVIIEVSKGDTAADIGRNLYAAGVVKSVMAFIEEANRSPEMAGVQPGFYRMRKEMSAEWAVTEILDPENRVEETVLIPEGFRSGEILERIAKETHIELVDLEAVLDNPAGLGLPEYANGNVEGYLFPATYVVPPNMTAEEFLNMMVTKTKTVLTELDVESKAAELGQTPGEIMTIASIIQGEARNAEDFPKVSRVIYNRLEKGMALEMDSTVHFVSDSRGDAWTSSTERDSDSKYNTYKFSGLPPGPIGAPGEAAIKAALNPASGNWFFFVTVDLESGETIFEETYAAHLKNVAKLSEYCKTSDLC